MQGGVPALLQSWEESSSTRPPATPWVLRCGHRPLHGSCGVGSLATNGLRHVTLGWSLLPATGNGPRPVTAMGRFGQRSTHICDYGLRPVWWGPKRPMWYTLSRLSGPCYPLLQVPPCPFTAMVLRLSGRFVQRSACMCADGLQVVWGPMRPMRDALSRLSGPSDLLLTVSGPWPLPAIAYHPVLIPMV